MTWWLLALVPGVPLIALACVYLWVAIAYTGDGGL
jgi:hypothetical protein